MCSGGVKGYLITAGLLVCCLFAVSLIPMVAYGAVWACLKFHFLYAIWSFSGQRAQRLHELNTISAEALDTTVSFFLAFRTINKMSKREWRECEGSQPGSSGCTCRLRCVYVSINNCINNCIHTRNVQLYCISIKLHDCSSYY